PAHEARLGHGPDQGKGLDRLRAPGEVASEEHRIHALPLDLGQHGLECRHVRVDVVERRYTHLVTACRSPAGSTGHFRRSIEHSSILLMPPSQAMPHSTISSRTRWSRRAADARTMVRNARAIRPWRPITLPTSSGATESWTMIAPSRSTSST